MKQRKQEPDNLYVEVICPNGLSLELKNDGVSTQLIEYGESVKTVLQPRAAFRGFVGSLSELLGYHTEKAWGEWADEEGLVPRGEEEGGEG